MCLPLVLVLVVMYLLATNLYSGGQKLKIFNIFEMNREKRDFLRKTSLRQNRIFYFAITQKLIDTIEIFNFSNSNLYEICQNCENLQIILWLENLLKIWYKVLHKFFFKYLVDKIFLALSKYLKIHLKFKFRQKFVKIMNTCKLFCSSKFIKLFVFISNVKYSRLTNHLHSESFFAECMAYTVGMYEIPIVL
ncbi:hypothetical protein AGLY_001279 [Aphis glycines]|uniref:Uncharacterized protein n=1 Tax=Aphis glycines TaxID=307491 RepID=A0A6G0UBU2_APHGL|nr:hypothetical protein AGLY_001279 [Aphis glycines]